MPRLVMRIAFAALATVGLSVAVIHLGNSVAAQDTAKPQQNVKPFMRMKLDHAKTLLEALALEDFDKIAKSAQDISLLSHESAWNVMITEEYLDQSKAFRRSLASIREGAKQQNVDRAALGYVEMTIRCVECHKYVRKSVLPAVKR